MSETKVAEKVGAPLAWADGDFVRSPTGYAIGGVAPIGYSKPVKLPATEHLHSANAAADQGVLCRTQQDCCPAVSGFRVYNGSPVGNKLPPGVAPLLLAINGLRRRASGSFARV